jgi:hypothetical protein
MDRARGAKFCPYTTLTRKWVNLLTIFCERVLPSAVGPVPPTPHKSPVNDATGATPEAKKISLRTPSHVFVI